LGAQAKPRTASSVIFNPQRSLSHSSSQRQSLTLLRSVLALRIFAVALSLVSFCGATAVIAAQRVEATLDAGAAGIRYADSIDAAAATLSPSIRIASARASLGAAGSFSELSTGAWTSQAVLGASAFTSSSAAVRGEIAGTAAGSAHEDGTRTGQVEGLGRVHLMRETWGLWAGGGVGRAWDGASGHALVLGDAGVWWHRDAFTAVLSATPTQVNDSVRYVDGGLALRWLLDRAEIGATLGARAGQGLITSSGGTAWGTVAGVLWLTPRLGVVASAGSYPPDLAQGFPNGRFASLAIRLDSHPRWRHESPASDSRTGDTAPPRDSVTIAEREGLEQFVFTSSDTERTIRVRAPRASSVELAGDVTNWEPLALTSMGDGWWVITISAPSGIHQVSFRLDGGRWLSPPGTVAVTDEFGGAAGMWEVP
jgi:hypothetical protein